MRIRPSSSEAPPQTFRLRLGVLVLGAAGLTSLVLHASTPTFWQIATQADFLKGEVEHLAIQADGRLVLGPASRVLYDSSAPFVWTLTPGSGGAVWVGSGNDGKVFRIDRGGKATTVFDSDELEVHALATAPDGTLFVGTSPDGRVYRVDATGRASPFFDPEDKYIWALALARDGALYVAAGEKGIIYRVSADGKGEVFYDTKATHVMSLAFDRSGQLLAGTASPGKVFRIDNAGKGFVLLDTSFGEIRAIRPDADGGLYVVAVSGKAGPEPETPTTETSRAPVASVSTEIMAVAIADVQIAAPVPPATARRDDRTQTGAVYRIAPDGLWDFVWTSSEDSPYDLVIEDANTILIGTGSKGKIYRVTRTPPTVTLVARAPAQQVTSLFRDAGGATVLATANPGKVLELSAGGAARGSYVSEVRDAKTVATWGALRWRAVTPSGTELHLLTRSGNTARPDDTWSEWVGPLTNGETIRSPKARYLQWRAELLGGTTSPVLTSVTAAYLERNLRPVVDSITVQPPGSVFQKPFSTGEMEIAGFDRDQVDPQAASGQSQAAPALGRRTYQKGLQTFIWKASDPNDDQLVYDVSYRAEGSSEWTVLRRGLNDPIFVWDTTSVPDGSFVVQIAASDAPSNSPPTALSGALESTAFDVDNTAPSIRMTDTQRPEDRVVIRFTVEDGHSPIERVEYSLDASRWRTAYPVDGIPDSRVERFEVPLDRGTTGSVILRAVDILGNAATAETVLGAGR